MSTDNPARGISPVAAVACPELAEVAERADRGPSAPARRRASASFTVLELLVSMIVLGVLVVLLFDAFRASSDAMMRSQNKAELNEVMRGVMDVMSRDIERQMYKTGITNMYVDNILLSGWWWNNSNTDTSITIPTNAIFLLSDLTDPYDPNRYGSAVNVGYMIGKTNVGGISNKLVLLRGDDPAVCISSAVNPCGLGSTFNCSTWWQNGPPYPGSGTCPFTPNNTPGTQQNLNYWKILSENIIGLQFFFFTNNVVGTPANFQDQSLSLTACTTNYWPSTNSPDLLIPYSVGIQIYAIDSDSYNKALLVDSTLQSGAATNLIQNNLRTYYTRVFLPYATQN